MRFYIKSIVCFEATQNQKKQLQSKSCFAHNEQQKEKIFMKIRLIGLGKMGLNIARNMRDHNHEVVGYAKSPKTRAEVRQEGFAVANSLDELFGKREGGRIIVWLLVPSNVVDSTIAQVLPYLNQGDLIVDGGNSNFNHTLVRYNQLKAQGIAFVDLGTSGGTFGARNGACLMVGGEKEEFAYLEPLLNDISAQDGYAYMGAPGAGHFVKMVHNAIEYGMMQAIGEGFDMMSKSQFDLNLKAIASVWNHGSIIQSALIGNVENALTKDKQLANIQGVIDDSGEGMWFIEEALKAKVSSPVIANALFARYKSKDEQKFSEKVVAAMRNEFGGHAVYPKQ